MLTVGVHYVVFRRWLVCLNNVLLLQLLHYVTAFRLQLLPLSIATASLSGAWWLDSDVTPVQYATCSSNELCSHQTAFRRARTSPLNIMKAVKQMNCSVYLICRCLAAIKASEMTIIHNIRALSAGLTSTFATE